ncbi:FtsX-like permease family protein [Actinoplanes sp. CA-252034]|uniref:FtsX-like permease family protein n=1 Tax=Actinoplanes sp. CA-252034 TaxID=3239906 RepID=UPI003D95ABD2
MTAAWAMVRHRFASFAGTFVAVFLGVAVVAGSAALHLSSQPEAPARYDLAPVLVTPPDPGTGDDRDRPAWTAVQAADLATRLRQLAGVTAAVPDPWFYVQRLDAGRPVGDSQASLLDGHAWSSAALGGYRLTSGRAPSAPDEVVLGTASTPSSPPKALATTASDGTASNGTASNGTSGGDATTVTPGTKPTARASSSEKVTAKEATTEKAIPEGVTTGQATAGDAAASMTTGSKATAGEAPAGKAITGKVTPGDAAPGIATKGKTTAGKATADDATVGIATTRKTTAGKATADDATVGIATTGKTTAGDAAAGMAATGKATAGEAAVGKATAGESTAPGTVMVLTSVGQEEWRVTGTVDGPGFYVTDRAAAQRASGVRVIGLTVNGDAQRVADAAASVVGAAGVVRSGAERDALEPGSVTRIRWIGAQLLIALVSLGAFATVFVVSSTCALSAAQRRRELGLLRAVGATPGQVRRMMYAETALIAVIAGLLGAPAGMMTAPLLAEPMIRTGLEPAGFTVTWQPAAFAGAVVLGLVVALAGVTAAARRASRIPPLEALREAAADPRSMTPARWVAGLLCGAAGAALLVMMPSLPLETRSTAGLGAAMFLLSSAALLSPVLIVPLVRVVARPWQSTATGMLVREGTLTGVRRVASTAAPVLATVGLTVLLAGTVATIEVATGIDETARYPAGNVLVPDGTPGLSAAAVRAQGIEPELTTRVLITHGDRTAGRPVTGRGEALVLDRITAAELGATVGDTVTIRFADGAETRLPVAAVADEVSIPRGLVREHDPDALTSMVVLTKQAVAVPGARVLPIHDFVMEEVDEEGRLVDLFLLVLIGLTAGYTAIAVGNTLLMATAARRTEFQALRLAGAGTGQVLWVVTVEALLAVVVGAVLGGLVAVVSLAGVRAAVEDEIGRDISLVLPWGVTAAVTTLCTVLALIAAAFPILRRRPTST